MQWCSRRRGEEANCAHNLKKWQRRNNGTLAREQNRAVRETVVLPQNEGKEVNRGEGSSGDEQIRLNPYCVFEPYFQDKDGKGTRKDKGSRR
ncbi:Phytosulfokines 5 [Hordeum vulgare]|nr:Phytosulfokines 5 [Hordeum vulgare]